MNLIIGTAGHIDHGKTALVKALTGIDADRLPEEKLRGITVDLGFAEMTVGDTHFGIIDVPGHERFVKNMLAGAGGIDLVILVIAADEGVMPQTREHFDICRLLGIDAGVVVITKSDLADAETLELAKLSAAELTTGSFLEDAPVLCVSSRTGDGLDLLRNELVRLAQKKAVRRDGLAARLPIDRSFSVKGFGAVVTGTLLSGEVIEGTEMELLPERLPVRIRGVQTHGKPIGSAKAGNRVAVNLGGIDHSKVERGMTLTETGVLRKTQIIDAFVEVLKGASKQLRTRQRVRVHLGTAEVLARIAVLDESDEIAPDNFGFIQIRLESPVAAVLGERFIIRSYSPQSTIAGGMVIDPIAEKHRRKDLKTAIAYLSSLQAAIDDLVKQISIIVKSAGPTGIDRADILAKLGLRMAVLEQAIETCLTENLVVNASGRLIDTDEFARLTALAESSLAAFHKREPLPKGMPREALRERILAYLPREMFQKVIAHLEVNGVVFIDNEAIRLTSHKPELSPAEAALGAAIIETYKTARLDVPKLDEALTAAASGSGLSIELVRKHLRRFIDSGEIVKVTEEFYFHQAVIDELIDKLRRFASNSTDKSIDVGKFKELAGISRKYAIPLLEYFDRNRVTMRSGDKRLIL